MNQNLNLINDLGRYSNAVPRSLEAVLGSILHEKGNFVKFSIRGYRRWDQVEDSTLPSTRQALDGYITVEAK